MIVEQRKYVRVRDLTLDGNAALFELSWHISVNGMILAMGILAQIAQGFHTFQMTLLPIRMVNQWVILKM